MFTRINFFDPRKNANLTVAVEADVKDVDELQALCEKLGGERVEPEVAELKPPEETQATMAVSSATGKPGETVTVDVTGGSDGQAIDGFRIAVGSGHILEPAGFELGNFFKAYLGDEKFALYTKNPEGWPEPFVSVFLGFFKVDGDNVTAQPEPIAVPAGTVLCRLKFKIPQGVNPQERVLYFRDNWFKKKGGAAKARLMFTRGSGDPDEIVPGGIPVKVTPDAGKVTIT